MLSCTGCRYVRGLVVFCALAAFAQEKAPKPKAQEEEKMVVPGVKPDEAAPAVIQRLPAITSIYPQDGRPGQTVELSVRGEYLDGSSRVEFESPDVTAKVIEAGYTTARLKVTIAANAEPGQRYFRIFSPRGATNLLVFRLTKWPEFKEIPADGSLAKATPVSVPSITSGILHADMSGMAAWGEEADLYRFHAHKGQRLRFTVFGVRNIGTRIGMPQLNADLSLTILRADGRQISWDEGRFVWDSYLDQTFAEEADYIAAITVTRAPTTVVLVYPKFEPAFYELAIGNAPQLWNVFPIGAQRGKEVDLELRADFMPPNPKLVLQSHGLEGTILKTPDPAVYRLKLRSAPDASLGRHHITVRDESGTTAPLRFILGDLPEQLEAEPNDSREQAERLNWPVTVNGRMDRKADQDWYRVDVQPGQKLSFAIEAENTGGSLMDATLTLADGKGKILKFADDGPRVGLALLRDPKFTWTFKEGGAYYVKVESAYRQFGPDQIYRLTVSAPRPDFEVSLPGYHISKLDPPDRFNVEQGGKTKITVNLNRIDDFEDAVKLEVRGLPKGVTAKPVTIPAKAATTKIEIAAAPDAPLADSTVEIIGTAMVGGSEVVRKAILPAIVRGEGPGFWDYRPEKLHITVAPPVQFSLEILAETVFLVRGQSVEVPVKVDRRAGFTAPLKIVAQNLPPGVTLEEAEEIDQGKQIRMRLKASDSAAKTRLSDLIVVGEAQAAGRRYVESSPQVTLQLD